MATEAAAGGSARPRPWLLVLLGVAVLILLWQMFSGGTAGPFVPNRPGPRPSPVKPADQLDPAELDVRIESLGAASAAPDDGGRNPFRFQPKAPPPPPPMAESSRPAIPAPSFNPGPPVDPGPPAIGTLIKFIGIVDTGKERIGAFSDCRYTFSGREGEIMEGRYRLVRIQVESAVVEYVDGRGRTTLPLNGQACVGK